MKALIYGSQVASHAIPQVIDHALKSDDIEEFWRAYITKMSGAMAAQVGVKKTGEILQEIIGVTDRRDEFTNIKTH